MCHRLQYDSWAASPHKAKGVECETCHGPGADYWKAAIMKNRAEAVKNGLILPDVASCKQCHPKADADLLPRAHAHKPR